MHQIARIGTAAAIAVLIGTDARAAWTICNKTPNFMNVAIAYVNPSGGFTTEGWWRLRACGGCANLLFPNSTSDQKNVFFRAESDGGSRVEGPDQFCIGASPFKLNGGAANCGDRRGFVHKEINLSKLTTNITGGSAAGKVCLD